MGAGTTLLLAQETKRQAQQKVAFLQSQWSSGDTANLPRTENLYRSSKVLSLQRGWSLAGRVGCEAAHVLAHDPNQKLFNGTRAIKQQYIAQDTKPILLAIL